MSSLVVCFSAEVLAPSKGFKRQKNEALLHNFFQSFLQFGCFYIKQWNHSLIEQSHQRYDHKTWQDT